MFWIIVLLQDEPPHQLDRWSCVVLQVAVALLVLSVTLCRSSPTLETGFGSYLALKTFVAFKVTGVDLQQTDYQLMK